MRLKNSIAFTAIEQLRSLIGFLVSLMLAGIIQLLPGYPRAGYIGAFFSFSHHKRDAGGDRTENEQGFSFPNKALLSRLLNSIEAIEFTTCIAR